MENKFDSLLLNGAETGVLAVVNMSLASGANVNARGQFENTALCFAASGGFLDIVETLIAHKADLHLKGYCDMTALHLAARDGRTAVVKRLLDAGAGQSERVLNDVLTVASMSTGGRREIVEMLQKWRLQLVSPATGAEPNARMIKAAHDGNVAELEAALNAGASVKARDDRGMDALSWAALRGHLAVVKTLLSKGADPNSQGCP